MIKEYRHAKSDLPYNVLRMESFAAPYHEGQFRKNDVTPFMEHPREVVAIMVSSPFLFGEDELVAAMGHDLLEDTKCTFPEIYRAFGDSVAGMIQLLTKPETEHFRSKIYESTLKRAAPEVMAIKLADMYHNLIDLSGPQREEIPESPCRRG